MCKRYLTFSYDPDRHHRGPKALYDNAFDCLTCAREAGRAGWGEDVRGRVRVEVFDTVKGEWV